MTLRETLWEQLLETIKETQEHPYPHIRKSTSMEEPGEHGVEGLNLPGVSIGWLASVLSAGL